MALLFSCELGKLLKNAYFVEHLQKAPFELGTMVQNE